MALYKYPGSSRQTAPAPAGITEFEILKASHKFLRDEDERLTTWDEKLAGKYYSNLYREFAVCDLKHYKSGNFALRWRTEEEVLDGSGETTCGNTRCARHFPSRNPSAASASAANANDNRLTTLELPFAYTEQGESKSALVKVVLCARCVKKLMWKRTKEREREREREREQERELNEDRNRNRDEDEEEGVKVKEEPRDEGVGHLRDLKAKTKKKMEERKKKKKRSRGEEEEETERLGDDESRPSRRRRRSRSRSRSPRRSKEDSRAR